MFPLNSYFIFIIQFLNMQPDNLRQYLHAYSQFLEFLISQLHPCTKAGGFGQLHGALPRWKNSLGKRRKSWLLIVKQKISGKSLTLRPYQNMQDLIEPQKQWPFCSKRNSKCFIYTG